ncbi:MAG: EF-P beta-lysylation protein EpmB [Pseudomonadota bacterium]
MKTAKSLVQSLNINSVEKLADYLQLDIQQLDYSKQASDQFSFVVPMSFVKRMKKSDPKDPLLLQILPQKKELIQTPDYSQDPLGEEYCLLAPGLLQKYQHRVLLIVTPSCGIHCRYCFRRHSPHKQSNTQLSNELENNIQLIKSRADITEVILSGGDPLTLSDQRFSLLLKQLAGIKQLKRLRIHTRQLIVQPKRISKTLIHSLAEFPCPVVIVLHINHPAELSDEVIDVIHHLKQPNIQLLNQSVLLKDINDKSEILIQLSETLFQANILPYYLHMLDPVSGSQHFNVSTKKAIEIMNDMHIQLPGYLVPKLVKECPDDKYKRSV